jgi:DNA-binding transcriptional regulator YiaG
VTPEVILALKRTLPELDGARFYRALQPGIVLFIPEVAVYPPRLKFTSEQIEAARQFNLAQTIQTFRRQEGMDKKRLSGLLGVSPRMIQLYESGEAQIQKEDVLLKAAQVMGIAPWKIYLHYHPEILEIFP